MANTKTEYFFSKIVIIISAFFFLFVVLLFLLFTYIFYISNLPILSIILTTIFLLFLTTFPSFYRRVKLYRLKKPALVLTKDELIDNINQQSFKWSDIKSISSASIKITTRVSYIAISISNPDKYIEKIGNPYKRLTARISEKYFKGAFSIQPNIIKCNNIELLNRLIQFHNKNR